MTDKITLNELWESIDLNSVSFLNGNFEKIVCPLVEFLVTTISEKEKIEIGIFVDGRQKGSQISHEECDSQKLLAVKLKKSSHYELLLRITHGEKQLIYENKLSDKAIELIPKEICDLMQKVKTLEMPVSFYNSRYKN